MKWKRCLLTAGRRSYDEEGLCARDNSIGERGILRLMGEVRFAGEETQEWTALLRYVIADGAPQHGIASLEHVEHRTLGRLTPNLDLHRTVDLRQRSQMGWKLDSNHGRVCTSSDSTFGRYCAIGLQVFPE